ncbi:two-component system histidine kinase PnpS [Salirhabdus salicampi]|uniref:two-component system histidine kinase PnpS n=1 Tax=Salirhabdus salicampi TaxID=476102 RepID=UPI0020C3F329|nr:HAMP domain-containing sensor histidine kinase [Salirhabdus salicampi]MCP8617090.1 ATP-binding protein [Salirhabdus salicampi]
MKQQTTRTFILYSFLIVAISIMIGIIFVQITQKYVIDAVDERIRTEGSYLLSELEEEELSLESLYDLGAVSQQFELGLIYVDEHNNVPLHTIDNVLHVTSNEKEDIIHFVKTEMTTNTGDARGTLKNGVYYYPFTTELNDGRFIFLIPVSTIGSITKNIWILVGATLLVAILVIFLIIYNIVKNYVKPVRNASHVLMKLANGNYNARMYEMNYGEVGELSVTINSLARNLMEMSIQNEVQNDRLQAVVDNTDSGLMLVDGKGYIHLVNRTFLEHFKGKADSYVGFLYYEAVTNEQIHEIVRDVFMTEDRIVKTVVIPMGIERKYFKVFASPIQNDSKVWKGVVLAFHDVTDMKRLEEMRKDFVANVSHELKTPITSIKGFAETLLEGAHKDPNTLEQFLSIIYKESRRLQLLIHDLLELSKLEKDEFHLIKEEVRPARLVEDILQLVEHIYQEKQVSLETNLDKDATFMGDAPRIKQLLLNIISNAIQYTPKYGKVYINVQQLDNNIEISVKDTGIGIPSEDIPRIFERFYRVDKARSRNSGGTGLGLAIVKHIVEAHDGEIEVESKVDEGTTFIIRFEKKFTKA